MTPFIPFLIILLGLFAAGGWGCMLWWRSQHIKLLADLLCVSDTLETFNRGLRGLVQPRPGEAMLDAVRRRIHSEVKSK